MWSISVWDKFTAQWNYFLFHFTVWICNGVEEILKKNYAKKKQKFKGEILLTQFTSSAWIEAMLQSCCICVYRQIKQ